MVPIPGLVTLWWGIEGGKLTMKPVNDLMRASARLVLPLIPAVALSMLSPAYAPTNADAAGLANLNEPGSVIVFPKFQMGTVTVAANTLPMTEIRVGAVCPSDESAAACSHEQVTIFFHWVCPGISVGVLSGVCEDVDFAVTTSVDGKVVFSPNGGPISDPSPSSQFKFAPTPPCNRGYLIGWVINPQNFQPIRFDGLIGDAVLRITPGTEESYSAPTIQADPGTPEGTALSFPSPFGWIQLLFDGGAGHYQELPGQFSSDVRYDSNLKPASSDTQLVLLTLNAALSKSNPSTSVLLDFYDGKQDEMASVTTSFFCWEQVKLSPSPGLTSNFLSKNLTAAHAASLGAMSAEGVVTSGQASQPIPGAVVNVTLLVY